MLLARILASCSVPAIERSRLERLSAVDEMTLAFNNRYLLPRLHEEMDRARHSGSTLSILVMDLDRMGHVNESFGRDMGDRVLGLFSERVRAQTRRYDVLVRSGDDEFVLLMPTTSPTQAMATAEKLRKAVGRRGDGAQARRVHLAARLRSAWRRGTVARPPRSCVVAPRRRCAT